MNIPFPNNAIFYPAAVIIAAAISMYATKKIIFITRTRKIYDIPDNTRKIHGAEIPSLGGIGIFIGYIIVAAFFWRGSHVMPVIFASSAILFFTGIYDDIMNMRPSKKLVAQLIASFITIYFADIRIEALHDIFGIEAIPYWPGVIITTLCCTFFINVFNFIDGIDGLAGVLATLYLSILGILFASTGRQEFASVAFALAGATIGLLYYNIAPAKIYMGDTGSMFLGFTIFIFSLLFINDSVSVFLANQVAGTELFKITRYMHGVQQVMVLLLGMLYLPVFDAIRVFILRMSKGISPLKADRTHLHYYLLDAGFTHSQSVLVIVGTNVLTIAIAYFMQDMNILLNVACMTLLSLLVLLIVYRLRQKKINTLR